MIFINLYLVLLSHPFSQVRYHDCLDFGTQNVAHITPRVLVWKGNMINVFSDLDQKCRQQFGKKQLKEIWIVGHHPKVCAYFLLITSLFFDALFILFFCRNKLLFYFRHAF